MRASSGNEAQWTAARAALKDGLDRHSRPTPPAGRIVGAATLTEHFIFRLVIPTAALALVGVAAAGFFFTPAPAAAPLAGAPCAAPTEHEQLLVVIGWHQGRLAVECIYVGSRGTYSRRTVRHVAAK